MTVIAFLQARMNSSRFPKKVIEKIMGKEMIVHQVERLLRSKSISDVVVITSYEEYDDELVNVLDRENIKVFRGSLDDVLDRFYQASKKFSADHYIRVTGDCPLIDPEIIDEVISLHVNTCSNYTSNCMPPTFPDGLDIEIIDHATLDYLKKTVTSELEKEHLTLYIHNNPALFKIENYENPIGNEAKLRWTVDYEDDLEFVRSIYEALLPQRPNFVSSDIRAYLRKKPNLISLNNHHTRNEALPSE